MQIDVNAAADRAQLMRAQLTSTRTAQLNPKAPVSTDGRAVTDLASALRKETSEARANPLATPKAPMIVPVMRALQPGGTETPIPTPRPIARPAVDLKSSGQAEAKHPVVSDPGPAAPTTRLDALLADWGQSDSPFDLDGNGIVGAADLLMLLARLSEGAQTPEPTPGDVAVRAQPSTTALAEPQLSDPSDPNRPPTNDLDALLADWGQSDSTYDLDGDGIVGAADLLMLLAKLSGEGSTRPHEPHGDVAGARRPSTHAPVETPFQPNIPIDHDPAITPDDPDAIGDNATTITPPVIDDLHQNDSSAVAPPEVDGPGPRFDRLDRDHVGGLSRSELAARIRDMLLDHIAMSPNAKLNQFVREAMKQLSDHDRRNEISGERNPAAQRSSQTYQRMNLQEIARKLMQRLTADGPSDLAKFVQAGKLSANDTKVVLDRISMLNPNKLGVNVVG